MPDTRTQIIDAAEKALRARGYHAVSFRDLADELGVKSASIHYHFRHKEDLGLAVADGYAAGVAEALGPAGELTWPEAVARFAEVYRSALRDDHLQCLCGLLAVESPGLPDVVAERVAQFYRANLDWLAASAQGDDAARRAAALRVQAGVQGAMSLAIVLKDPGVLDETAGRLV